MLQELARPHRGDLLGPLAHPSWQPAGTVSEPHTCRCSARPLTNGPRGGPGATTTVRAGGPVARDAERLSLSGVAARLLSQRRSAPSSTRSARAARPHPTNARQSSRRRTTPAARCVCASMRGDRLSSSAASITACCCRFYSPHRPIRQPIARTAARRTEYRARAHRVTMTGSPL